MVFNGNRDFGQTMRWNYGLMLATLTVNPSHLPGEVSPLLRKTNRAVYARKALVQLKIMVISSVLSFFLSCFSLSSSCNGDILCFKFFFFDLFSWWPALYPFILIVCLFVFKSTCSRTMSEPSTAWLPALGCVKILRTPTTRLQKEGRPQKKKNYFAPQ